jgi:hypothetical protein
MKECNHDRLAFEGCGEPINIFAALSIMACLFVEIYWSEGETILNSIGEY